MSKVQFEMKTKAGSLFLVASKEALEGLYWQKVDHPLLKSLSGHSREVEILKQALTQLQEYFEGQRTEFSLPLSQAGTKFQKQVWKELARIPYGKMISYRELARRIKNAKAFRAVGTANGRNPISIIVPCHRVIAANGTLGGYSGGLDKKQLLLELERRT